MEPVVLFRGFSPEGKDEIPFAEKHFKVFQSRIDLKNKLVIPRYCALPFYKELEHDLALQGSKMINTFHEHTYIASFDYYWDLEEVTPKTWFDIRQVPENGGPFVLKGKTNSCKFNWNRKMFAPDFEAAVAIFCELTCDPLIGDQGVVIRKYEKLKTYEIGINNLPFTNEWRFFFYKRELLSYGYYWSIAESKGEIDERGIDFAKEVAEVVAERVPYFVLDIAQKEDGNWILIEINDGQMSGLSENNPEVMYGNLRKLL